MLIKSQLHGYQTRAVQHIMDNNFAALWLEVGLGKTICSLTAIEDLKDQCQVYGTLVIAPLRICQSVWRQEAKNWAHTQGLSFSLVHGTPKQRMQALFSRADVYLINYESLMWLSDQLIRFWLSRGKHLPFNMVVFDEVSKMSNSTSKRTKAFCKILPHTMRRIGLTGTPATNGLPKLHGQYLVLDAGQRLGIYKTHFEAKYFTPDFMGYKLAPRPGAEDAIRKAIQDITFQASAKDYLTLPKLNVQDIFLPFTPKAHAAYQSMEEDFFLAIDNGEVEAFNQAARSMKLLQVCNGHVYIEAPEYLIVHDAKLDALDDIVEEMSGNPLLVCYNYRSDAQRIKKKFPHAIDVKDLPADVIVDQWNKGEIPLLMGHPACLHPSTEVLTEFSGWVKIIDVDNDTRVFDGIEFVSHGGCSYSGHKPVIDVFGVSMTHNHRLLVDGHWEEASNVRNNRSSKRKALYQYQGDDKYLSKMCSVWGGVENSQTECVEAQQTKEGPLSGLCSRCLPLYDKHTDMADLVGYETPRTGYFRQRLCRARHWVMRRVERIQKLLHRYGYDISLRPNYRANGREQGVLQSELHMGNCGRSTVQQKNYSQVSLPWCGHAPSSVVSHHRTEPWHTNSKTESGDERGPSGRERGIFQVSEEPKVAVYDLVNCGKRSRFLIRNSKGEMFISHNSMGHGLNLQRGGHHLVWFGLPWDLELYEQTIGRLMRQGQTKPVFVHRLMMENSMEQAVSDALESKGSTQQAIKDAIKKYQGELV